MKKVVKATICMFFHQFLVIRTYLNTTGHMFDGLFHAVSIEITAPNMGITTYMTLLLKKIYRFRGYQNTLGSASYLKKENLPRKAEN